MATTTFDNLITFSRGSNATLTGPTGLVQWAPMNLLTNSQDFEATAWVKYAGTVTSNTAVAPDGSVTADTFTANGVSTGHRIEQTFAAGSPRTFSVYIKAGTASFAQIIVNADVAPWANFDLSNGTIGSQGTNQTATITAVGNGWYRCTLYTNSAIANGVNVVIVSSATSARGETNTSTGSINLWGAQLELGTTATTYNNTSVRNLLGYSEAFDNAAWTKTRASMVTGAAANPLNGLFNAQKLMEDASASSTHFTFQQATAVASSPYTTSVYMKAGERTRAQLRLTDSGGNQFFAVNVNLSNGTFTTASFGSPTGTSGSVTAVGNGWYRVSVTAQIAYTSLLGQIILADATGNISYTGDGNSGIYIYGAQLSNSASLDPYVPTPGAAPSSAAYYGPRFDYDPVTLQPKGLLVEEQRTNLLLQSQFASGWSTNAATTTFSGTNVTAPDGTLTGRTVNDTSTSVAAYVFQGVSFTSGTTYAMSVYVKKGATNFFTITSFTQSGRAIFNLNTNAVDSVTGIVASATITNVGNGWYRCTAIMTATATASNNVGYGDYEVAPSGDLFSIWGAQLEAGAFATSYIPTVASTVTRSADVATITGTNFAQWFNQAQGTFVVQYDCVASPGTSYIIRNYSPTVSQGLSAWLLGGRTSAYSWIGANNINYANAAAIGNPNKIAFSYTSSALSGSLNGGAVPSTAGTVPSDINRLEFGEAGNLNGHIRSITFIPARAADYQLQAATS